MNAGIVGVHAQRLFYKNDVGFAQSDVDYVKSGGIFLLAAINKANGTVTRRNYSEKTEA